MVQVDGVEVQVALQWCSDAFSDSLLGFVNSVKTIDGGTHMDGFKAALTRTVNSLGRKNKTLKEGDANLSGDHVREGLSAIVSVKASHHIAYAHSSCCTKPLDWGVVAQPDPTRLGCCRCCCSL